ncbi:hypothetical protein FP2506_04891 [Fulvimarina pelagi HTCC2506]|uniref:Uncharacterized protein n=2 Tax=Fulvimarina pelagi TaxID=217511 RepID=Q0FZQ4_9HYPH|nr:hypothetical protein FP2506_04891 [Fulvimarina pelagi HTCC2506]BAT31560.1 hypothetical protein [Fulvimarina pelagi]
MGEKTTRKLQVSLNAPVDDDANKMSHFPVSKMTLKSRLARGRHFVTLPFELAFV